eukprot:UN06655
MKPPTISRSGFRKSYQIQFSPLFVTKKLYFCVFLAFGFIKWS